LLVNLFYPLAGLGCPSTDIFSVPIVVL